MAKGLLLAWSSPVSAEGRLDPTDTMDVSDHPPVLHWYQAAE